MRKFKLEGQKVVGNRVYKKRVDLVDLSSDLKFLDSNDIHNMSNVFFLFSFDSDYNQEEMRLAANLCVNELKNWDIEYLKERDLV